MIMLLRPSRGHITQRYGNTQPDGMPHAGQDYAYTNGKDIFPEVYAAADGVVQFAGDSRNLGWPNPWYVNPDFNRADNWDSSAGNLIAIRHKQFNADTGYGHLEKCFVKAGDTVRAGQVIGIAGETGNSRGKHLHFFLMFRPFNYATSTYGCSDPNPYFVDAQTGSVNYQGTIITPLEEDDMFTDEDRKALIDARNEATNAKVAAREANTNADTARSEATNAKNNALACFQAVTGLLQTKLPDPANPEGYQPSLAEWIVYGNLKAGGAQQVASKLTPDLIAAAVAKASSEVDAQAIADRLTVTVKEG